MACRQTYGPSASQLTSLQREVKYLQMKIQKNQKSKSISYLKAYNSHLTSTTSFKIVFKEIQMIAPTSTHYSDQTLWKVHIIRKINGLKSTSNLQGYRHGMSHSWNDHHRQFQAMRVAKISLKEKVSNQFKCKFTTKN